MNERLFFDVMARGWSERGLRGFLDDLRIPRQPCDTPCLGWLRTDSPFHSDADVGGEHDECSSGATGYRCSSCTRVGSSIWIQRWPIVTRSQLWCRRSPRCGAGSMRMRCGVSVAPANWLLSDDLNLLGRCSLVPGNGRGGTPRRSTTATWCASSSSRSRTLWSTDVSLRVISMVSLPRCVTSMTSLVPSSRLQHPSCSTPR